MTKDQVEREIARLNAKRSAAWSHKSATESAKQKMVEAAVTAAKEKIWAQAQKKYGKTIDDAKKKHDDAGDEITALRIKYAHVLSGVPVNCTLEEWRQDYQSDGSLQWMKTGRKGQAEVFLHGSEWPNNKRWDKPDVGKMIVRVLGKNGRPTQVAEVVSRVDSLYRKYKWEPEKKLKVVSKY